MPNKNFRTLAMVVAIGASVAHADPDGTIAEGYGSVFGRTTIGASAGLGGAQPKLDAMAVSASGRTWLFAHNGTLGSDTDLRIARLMSSTGLLDAGFGGGDGLVVTPIPANFNRLGLDGALTQADGKPILFGRAIVDVGDDVEFDGAVCRLTLAGALDPTFGVGGCRTIHASALADELCTVRDVAIVPESGALVVVGECRNLNGGTPQPSFVAGLTAAGNFNPEFAGGGLTYPTIAGVELDYIAAIAMQQDGRFMAAGSVLRAGGDYDMALMQFSNDGTLDPGYSGDGAVLVALDLGGSMDDLGLGIALRPDGRVLVAGLADSASGVEIDAEAVIVQLLANGDIDSSFGTNGLAQGTERLHYALSFGAEDAIDDHRFRQFSLDREGRSVVLGLEQCAVGDCYDIRVFRFTANGGKDRNFGYNQRGVVDIDHDVALAGTGNVLDSPVGMTLEAGRIVIGASTFRNNLGHTMVTVALNVSVMFADQFESD